MVRYFCGCEADGDNIATFCPMHGYRHGERYVQSKKVQYQPPLLDTKSRITNTKFLSPFLGDFFEEASANCFNLTRLAVNPDDEFNADLIADLVINANLYYECRASHINRSVFIKPDQLSYYNSLAKPNNKIYYILWFHNFKLSERVKKFPGTEFPQEKGMYPEDIRNELTKSVECVLTINLDTINFLSLTKQRFSFKFLKDYLDKIDGVVESVKRVKIYNCPEFFVKSYKVDFLA